MGHVNTFTMTSNSAKGRDSRDLEVGDSVISFFNRNVSQYPTEVGSTFFAPVDVKEQKDLILNVARANAEQEYQRIMGLVRVLQEQAENLQKRLMLTELVHQAKFSFKPVVNSIYWLVDVDGETVLTPLGPNDWSTGYPENYKYIDQLRFLGDFTWINVEDQNENI